VAEHGPSEKQVEAAARALVAHWPSTPERNRGLARKQALMVLAAALVLTDELIERVSVKMLAARYNAQVAASVYTSNGNEWAQARSEAIVALHAAGFHGGPSSPKGQA
jgi:hypothetical protein